MRERLPPRYLRIDENQGSPQVRQLPEGVCQMLFAAETRTALLQSPGVDPGRNGQPEKLPAAVDETKKPGRSLACEQDVASPVEWSPPSPSGSLAAPGDPADRGPAVPRERPPAGSSPVVAHREPVADRSHTLSGREREVLRLVARGLGTRQISQVLQVGTGTIRGYRRSIIHKLGLRGVARLTKYAVAVGLSSLNE